MPQTPPQSDEEDDAKYYCPSCRCASCKAIAAIYEKCPNCSRRCCADKDGEYVEGGESEKQRRATGLLPPTPLARTKSMTGTSITQKNKAVLAARTAMNRTPKGPAVCLLSLEDDFVETCHVVRKALPSEMLDKLEYSWGYKRDTFNVDSSKNLIHLSPTLHAAFDWGVFAFVPDQRSVDVLLRVLRNPQEKLIKKYYNQETFCYQVVYLEEGDQGKQSKITRCTDQSTGTCHTYLHPYSDIPPINSHMYPHMALFNLGEKMQKLHDRRSWINEHVGAFPQLVAAWYVYEVWMEDSPQFKAWINGKAEDDGRPKGPPNPGSRAGSRSASHHSQSSASHQSSRPQLSRAAKKSAASGKGDTVAPQDSVSEVDYDINESTDDEDDRGKVEEFEESWSDLQKRVDMWRESVLTGLSPGNTPSDQELLDAHAIQRTPSGDSDESGTLISQTEYVSAPEKMSGISFDIDPSPLPPLSA